MKIGIVGCGYVFDHYMATAPRYPRLEIAGVADRDPARLRQAAHFYGLKSYSSNEALLADPDIALVVNLTSIASHFDVTRAALEAGKHVYSEKPLAGDLESSRALLALAQARGKRLACAPCNVLSDSAQTLWKAVREGAIGAPRLVYAEFDDNVLPLMRPESWRSRSGAPWPWREEFASGCTWEHAGYHLSPLCALFGPVASVTAFSRVIAPDKTPAPLDTPDFSVACLNFANGVVARLTFSISAPADHSLRVIGSRGMLSVDSYRHYRCPVYLETFDQISLNARKFMSVRRSSALRRLLGVGGRPLPLLRLPLPSGGEAPRKKMSPGGLRAALKRREVNDQDKLLGVAELAEAIDRDRPAFPPPDFILHIAELTFAIQGAGVAGGSIPMTTSFAPLQPRPETLAAPRLSPAAAPAWRRWLGDRLAALHKH
jgi:predicted dehydrogenase